MVYTDRFVEHNNSAGLEILEVIRNDPNQPNADETQVGHIEFKENVLLYTSEMHNFYNNAPNHRGKVLWMDFRTAFMDSSICLWPKNT